MERFCQRHQDRILGVLSGFDRLLFRGTLRSICYLDGLEAFLARYSPFYTQFAAFVEKLSKRVKDHAQALAAELKRPYLYLASSAESKEERARQIIQADGLTAGLVCILACVEPCQTYALRGRQAAKTLHVVPAQRQCLHLYFYYLDPEFGLLHIRVQSWLPFTIQIYVNGREYLARQMDQAGIGYEQQDNCFTRIDDLPRAQQLLEQLTTRKWAGFLTALAQRVNPWLNETTYGFDQHGYYWTLAQSEYATDIMFRDAPALQALYPKLVSHAIEQLSCADVLRFLGRRTDRRFVGQVTSDVVKRIEGMRVKHRVETNSLKMYDKQGSILRIETTINDPSRFRVRRQVTRKGQLVWQWVPMRKGLADLPRRVEVCRAANERYLQALAVVGLPQPVAQLLDPVSRPVERDGRPYRPLRPLTAADAAVFRVLLRGEYALQGVRNEDVRRQLHPQAEADPGKRRRASARITRWFRLLRAHGLVFRVPGTRYYRLTDKGRRVMTLALQLRDLDLARLAA